METWTALYSICKYKIDEGISDMIDKEYYNCYGKEKNVNLVFKINDIENTSWNIMFKKNCNILINRNNERDCYTLIKT